MQLKKLIHQYLEKGRMMQVATLAGDQPWVCTVYFVPDELSLYWISPPTTRHSQEINKHAKVAAAIPIKHVAGQSPVGIQIEGAAQRINDPEEIKRAIRLYAERYETGDQWYKDFIAGKNQHKLYRIKPSLFVVFDEETYPDSPRKEWRPKT